MLNRVASALKASSLPILSRTSKIPLDPQHLRQPPKQLPTRFNTSTKQRNIDVSGAIEVAYRNLAASRVARYSNHLTKTIERRKVRKRAGPKMATASSDGGDISKRTQQSPLAAQREKDQGLQPRKGGFFTLGYKEAVSQWWASVTPAAAEHKVMSYIPHLKQPPTQTQTGNKPIKADGSSSSGSEDEADGAPCMPVRTNSVSDPYGTREWRSNLVKLSGKNRAINEFSVERIGERVDNNLVMVHGYGAGLGFFYKNFEALSQAKGWKIYALDMLGMGRSSRPPFKIHAKEGEARIREAEDWFIDAIEEWRVQRRIERFTLLGHSLGGYLAVAYALKYPGHLNKLVLASPVGIPEDPYAINAEMPEPPDSTMTNEVLQDQQQTTTQTNPNIPESAKVGGGANNNNFLGAKARHEAASAASKTNGNKDTTAPTAPRRPYPKWLTYLWDANFSPFGLIRWSGPLGPRFVSGWTSRRFNHLPPDEAQALHTYAYTLFKQRGSGEYALAYLLAPGAFARSPLIHRIGGVGRQPILPPPPSTESTPSVVHVADVQDVTAKDATAKETGIPVVLMYGENDWMDVKGGYASEKALNEVKEKVLREGTEEEKRRENGDAKVVVIRKAGHHVYLDGFEQFNAEMLAEMRDVERREQRLGRGWEGC